MIRDDILCFRDDLCVGIYEFGVIFNDSGVAFSCSGNSARALRELSGNSPGALGALRELQRPKSMVCAWGLKIFVKVLERVSVMEE